MVPYHREGKYQVETSVLILGPIFLNIFNSILNKGAKGMLMKFIHDIRPSDDSRLCSRYDTKLDGIDNILEYINKIQTFFL